MAITILNATTTTFTLNGIEYQKNFQSIVNGDNIKITNVYDSKQVLVDSTIYSDFIVDGNTYASAILLQGALVDILFDSYYIEFDNRITTTENDIEALYAGQTGGLKSFTTLALLQAYATPNVNDSYKVTNDSTTSNNGYYHWVSGTNYVKDANLVVSVLNAANTSDGVSGKAVADYTATLRGGEVASGETKDVSGGEVNNYLKGKDFIKRYLKPNDLVNNEAYSIYNNIDELNFGKINGIPELIKSKITLPDDFDLAFDYAINLKTTAPATVNKNVSFRYQTKFKNGLKVSYWSEVVPSLNQPCGMKMYYIEGLNDTEVKYINGTTTISTAIYGVIKTEIDTNGFWSTTDADRVLYVNGYYEYNGRYFLNFAVDVLATVTSADYVAIDFGYNGYIGIGNEWDRLYFGFQVYEDGFLDQTQGEPKELSIGEQGAFDYNINNAYKDSYKYDNHLIDFFNGGRKITYTDGSTVIRTANKFKLTTGFSLTNVGTDDVLGDKFELEYNNGSNLPKWGSIGDYFLRLELDNYILSSSDRDKATIGFWVNRTEFNGNGLLIEVSGGQWFLRPQDMVSKGFIESRKGASTNQNPVWEVKEVFGDFSYIQTNLYNLDFSSSKVVQYSIYNTGGDIQKLTFYNPTMLYNKNIDPFYKYESIAEKNKSKLIGKKVLYIGDSQYNYGHLAVKLAINLGCNVIDAHYGGHSMAIRSSQRGQTNYNSFYHKNLRDAVLSINDVDLYIITASTNDANGGGDLSTVAVQDVIDNYPAYGDDSATVIAKQALFDALTNGEVDDMFAYKNCYSAYLKQLQELRPNAKIIITSVPISCATYLTGNTDIDGKGIWVSGKSADIAYNELNTGRQTIREDSIAVAYKHNCNYIDLLNEVGLTYWNFTTYSIDGTHWYNQDNEIEKRIAERLIFEIKKIKL